MPDIIQFQNGNQIKNLYEASRWLSGGQKLRVVNYSSNKILDIPMGTITPLSSTPTDYIVLTTDYVGNMIYENGALKEILLPEGYYQNGTFYYYLKDHLGDNRVTINSSGAVVEKSHYYPSGTRFFTESTSNDLKPLPYRYNGKELEAMNGLNQMDYGARRRFSWGPIWTGVDPLAELTSNISPYVYCKGNPLTNIDPTGMWTETDTGYTTNDPNEISDFFNQQKNNNQEEKIEKPDPINNLKEEFLNFFGWDLNPADPKDRKKLDEGSKNRVKAAKDIKEVNKFLIINGVLFFTGEGVSYCIEEFGGAILVRIVGKESIQAAETFLNFTGTTAAHMDEAKRMIPVQVLDDIIKYPMFMTKDPQGTSALMHYSQILKNGKLYNVEVLYDNITNTIMHFEYTRKAIGPLLAIPK